MANNQQPQNPNRSQQAGAYSPEQERSRQAGERDAQFGKNEKSAKRQGADASSTER